MEADLQDEKRSASGPGVTRHQDHPALAPLPKPTHLKFC